MNVGKMLPHFPGWISIHSTLVPSVIYGVIIKGYRMVYGSNSRFTVLVNDKYIGIDYSVLRIDVYILHALDTRWSDDDLLVLDEKTCFCGVKMLNSTSSFYVIPYEKLNCQQLNNLWYSKFWEFLR